jgi:predicted metal-dependent HD superfamily phosphohydrolase
MIDVDTSTANLLSQTMTTDTAEPGRQATEAGTWTDERLRDRFTLLWHRCALPSASFGARAAWSSLECRYAESHRHYHDKRHLAHCLSEFDLAIERIVRPDQVEMAIWFHDIINEPGRSDNEALSAELFRDLAGPGMSVSFVGEVVDLILVTTHLQEPIDPDHRILCDIDLSSLGCPWESYLRDTGYLRAEFGGSDQEYWRSKRAFLESMLCRPRIFVTDFFYDRYERLARENLRKLLGLIDEWEVAGGEGGADVPALRTSGFGG